MNKKVPFYTCLIILTLIVWGIGIQKGLALESGVTVSGKVLESGTGLPLKQVSISVSSTGKVAETNELGLFTIEVPDKQAELIIDLPGYNKRKVFLLGRESITVSLVLSQYRSFDNTYNNQFGTSVLKDATNALTSITSDDLVKSSSSSFDQNLQGKIPGLNIIEQSGMPGHKTLMNIRGISSIFGSNQPLLFIDGMIHDYSYATNSLMEGFSLNPMDVVDVEDIADVSIIRDGVSDLGSAGSNGVIYVNTEQKGEASTVINISAYAGITMVPNQLDVLKAEEFKNYFSSRLNQQGYSNDQVNAMYPWLNGNLSSTGYYKYNNSTDWQSEIFKPGILQKYHIFLKGGDDIATYNISAGFLNHDGLYDKSSYSRFNLRINGKINITEKITIFPNAKLSLADSYLPNHGPSIQKNPIISALLIPPVLAPFSKDPATGDLLPFYDDVSVFNVSNPSAIVANSIGSDRNYHFLSSINAQYKINEHFYISNLIGINFNNARENIFIPDNGLVQIDSAANSPGDFINEFRSAQNHATIAYSTQTVNGHIIDVKAGMRYLSNSYKYNKGIDLNTPSDDFKSLGDGSKYNFLRSSTGDNRELKWISYFGNLNYNFRNKYYLTANISYDGNSAVNAKNRYNLFPSIGAAWRLSSEKFLSQAPWLDDLKLRASWSLTGNMFSNVYDYSKLYYIENRLNQMGVIVREIIPNENMELEKKATINAGFDLSLFKQSTNIHVDYFRSNVDNMIIEQSLSPTFGYTNYYDNGGKLGINGYEIALDQKIRFGSFSWTLGGNISQQISEVTSLNLINKDENNIITSAIGAEYITSVGNPVNAFYGFQTQGIFATEAEASQFTGPKGVAMHAGDVKFADLDNNKIINEADKDIIGNPNPDFFGGFFTKIAFKNIELSASFNYSVGNDVFNYVRYKAESMDTYGNQFRTVLDRWSSDNMNATMPRASLGDPTGNTLFSDRWIEDGSYIRLNQLTLSYNLPQTDLYKGISIYVTATNLFTFTKYTGYDPEFVYLNNPFNMGIDYGQMPQARSVILGLKLDL